MAVLTYIPIVLALAWGATMLFTRCRGKFRIILIALAIFSALLGFLGSLLAEIQYPLVYANLATPLLGALPLALALSIVLAFLSFPVLRLTNPLGTIDPFLPAAVLALMLGSSTSAFLGWEEWSNGYLDSAPSRQHQAIVYDTVETSGRSGKHFVLAVMIDEKPARVAIEAELFAQIKAGDSVSVWIRPGYQGMNWAERVAKQ